MKIKELRKQRKLTQRQLADRLQVGYRTVSHWEQGLRCPSSTTRKKLAKYFGIQERDLF